MPTPSPTPSKAVPNGVPIPIAANPALLVETDVNLKPYNTFGLPAVARRLVRIREAADVRRVVDHPELGRAPKFVLGGGSNLVLTKDVDAVVLKVEIPGIRLLGDAEGVERVGLWAFDVDGVHAHDVSQFLDDRGIAVRVGHHCAQPLHRRFGLTASVRASASVFTTEAEIDVFLDAVSGVRSYFGVAR